MQKVKDIAIDKRFDTQRTTDNINIIIEDMLSFSTSFFTDTFGRITTFGTKFSLTCLTSDSSMNLVSDSVSVS